MEDTKAPKKISILNTKKITGLILLLVTAAVFLFSGISKLYAFEQFVWNIMDAGVRNMRLASVLARVFIGFEIMLGLFLICHLFLKNFTYPAIIALLTLFTFYLIVLIIRQGNSGNCGCFGEAYEMKPLAAIIKNAVMIATVFLLLYIYPVKPYRHSEWIAAITGMGALVLPFIFFPMSGDQQPKVVHEYINLSPLFHSQNPENKVAPVALDKGKHIVAFMSLTCPHCRKAAFLLQVIHRQHPDFPIFFVLNGHPDLLDDFYQETHSQNVPHMLFRGAEEFRNMAGESVPAIYFINNSIIEREANYYQLNPEYIEAWLKNK